MAVWLEQTLRADIYVSAPTAMSARGGGSLDPRLLPRLAAVPGVEGTSTARTREALSSLYTLFGETRRILRAAGPAVARPRSRQLLTFGQIAVDVLNIALRPVLAKWHPLLIEHEASRGTRSATEHERAWDKAGALRAELASLRAQLAAYADLLARACAVAPLHTTQPT